MAVVLRPAGENRFELDCRDLDGLIEPVQSIVGAVARGASGPVVVHRLDMMLVQALPNRMFIIIVKGATEVHLKPRATKERQAREEYKRDDADSDAVEIADPDASSVVSDREPEAEHEVEEIRNAPSCALDALSLEDVESKMAFDDPVTKAPYGIYVDTGDTDGYFTLTIHPGCYVQAYLKPRWRKDPPDGMGAVGISKTVNPLDFNEDTENPRISKLVLCSWKLWRSKQGGFNESSPARKSWFNDQFDRLLRGLLALGDPSGRTGNSKADCLIAKWTPEAFSVS